MELEVRIDGFRHAACNSASCRGHLAAAANINFTTLCYGRWNNNTSLDDIYLYEVRRLKL